MRDSIVRPRLRKVVLTFAVTVLGVGGAVAMPTMAHASVALAPDVTDKVGGGVWAMAQGTASDGVTRNYLGGSFASVGGRPRSNVAAVVESHPTSPTLVNKVDRTFFAQDPATNTAVGTNGRVLAIAVSADGNTVYLGGTFTEVGGVPRANLAAVDAITGRVKQDWVADTGGTTPEVSSLAVHGDRLYVAGRFTSIDGALARYKRLVALDTAGNVDTAFKPVVAGGVREVVVSPDGATVYVGGAFTALNGQPREQVGAVLASTGAPTGFAPTEGDGNRVTVALSPNGNRVFYSTENNTLTSYNLSTPSGASGASADWSLKTSGNVQAIVAVADEVWIGGHFSQIVTGKHARPFIASLTPSGTVNTWDPQCTGGKLGVWALFHDGDDLHAGGLFTAFGGVSQRGYARFSQL